MYDIAPVNRIPAQHERMDAIAPYTDGSRMASDPAGEDARETIAAAVAGDQRCTSRSETAGPITPACRLSGLAGLSTDDKTSEREVTNFNAEIRVNQRSNLSPDRSICERQDECKPGRGREFRAMPRTPYRVTRQYKNHKRTKGRAAKVRKYA